MIQFTALITANEFISLIVIHHLNQILVFPQQHKTKPGLENKKKPNNNNKTLLFCSQCLHPVAVCFLSKFSHLSPYLLAGHWQPVKTNS